MRFRQDSLEERMGIVPKVISALYHIQRCQQSGAIAWIGIPSEIRSGMDYCEKYRLARLETSGDGYQSYETTKKGDAFLEQVVKYAARRLKYDERYLKAMKCLEALEEDD